MPESVLDAIKQGIWDYEPDAVDKGCFESTHALPGTNQKLAILADRLEQGLPLWHEADRRTYDDASED